MTESQAIDDTSTPATGRLQFSLQTMFLLMAAPVAVVWLFASHGLVVGMIFSLFIYVIVRSIYLDRRAVAIVATILCLSCWIGLQFFGPYTSFRNRVRWKIGVERLQEWTISTLDTHRPITSYEAIEEIPEDIRGVLPTACLVSDSSNMPKYVRFSVDPNRDTHGLMVGRPGFVPPATKYHTEKLADGVWAYRPDSAYW